MRPKPELLSNEFWDIEAWKRETLVWCAEAMQDAADRIERSLASTEDRNSARNAPASGGWFARLLRGDLNV